MFSMGWVNPFEEVGVGVGYEYGLGFIHQLNAAEAANPPIELTDGLAQVLLTEVGP